MDNDWPMNNVEEYDLDALLGADDYGNTDQDKDDEGHQHQGEQSSSKRRKKRFSLYQIQELESSFEVSAHPDDSTRQALAQKTGFVTEASKENSVVRGSASYLAGLLSDVSSWSKMFPGVIAGVRASNIIRSGHHLNPCDGLIQEMHVDMWVQSPCTPNRSIKFLRYTKKIESNKWAVVDVSMDGIRGIEPESSRIGYMSCRLQPSGCLLEDNIISKGISKVTWIVHAEYDETTVPLLFRHLFKSGQALGASRWLASFQRQCESMNILNSCINDPRGSTSEQAAMSGIARRTILELAQRMMPSFYAAVSKPAALLDPSNNIVQQWIGRCGTAPNMFDVTVRMVMSSSCPAMGVQPVPVLSATTTVWLPGTPPLRLLDYLCDGQRRGEWVSFSYGSAVEELTSVQTWRTQRGNVVSVLQPTDEVVRTNFSNVLLLQEATNDLSCSLVVFSFVAKEMLLAAMHGADHSSIFLMPSGLAIPPDGYGNPHEAHRASAVTQSSSAPNNYNRITGGSILTTAFQALLPSSMSNHSLDATGNRVCLAINKILAAVGDDMAFAA